MKPFVQAIRRCGSSLAMVLFRAVPVDQKKVVFSSYFGTALNDNPWAIFEEMRAQHPEYRYVWLLRKPTAVKGASAVRPGTMKGLYHLATAKCWVDNSRKRSWVRKRRSQFYVQTWHGNIAFKRVEKDVADKLPALYVKAAKNDSKMADVFISGSRWLTESYRRSYWYDGFILESGLPRSDVFYKDPAPVCRKVDECFGESSDVHFCLYAPTFRSDDSVDCYLKDYGMLIEALTAKFGGEWKIFVRLHPRIANKSSFLEYGESVINASEYPDINDLIIRSDVLMTDYSSCMFDAMEAGKKVFLYTPDMEAYMEDRGCEFTLEELPFSKCRDQNGIGDLVKGFDEKTYRQKVQIFMEKCGICNKPDSARTVASYIFEQMKKHHPG